MSLIRFSEVQQHNSLSTGIWIAVHGHVYDLTRFAGDHPGGELAILNLAGRDATRSFDAVHPKSLLKELPPNAYLGELDQSSVPVENADHKAVEDARIKAIVSRKPPLEQILNIFDFENVARDAMSEKGWAYYCSGAEDEITLRENHAAFQRIWLRPRVLVDVSHIDMSTTFFGDKVSFPVYISATASGKLAHPDGELALTRAAHKCDIIQMCPTLGSYSLDEMLKAKAPGQVQWFQLYVNQDRAYTLSLIKKAEQGGCRAMCITVDLPFPGRRERDMRHKFTNDLTGNGNRQYATSRALTSFFDASLQWSDIAWFRKNTSMKIVLKGVQTGEDALLAVQHGVDGIIVSNHGGRQLDFARSGIEVLVEVMDTLKKNSVEKKIEVYVDGGIRRATDIVKALAVGARGVGIGRPFLWSLAGYGQVGVEHAIALLKDEMKFAMGLLGAPKLADITRDHIVINNVGDHFVSQPVDHLSKSNYVPLDTALTWHAKL